MTSYLQQTALATDKSYSRKDDLVWSFFDSGLFGMTLYSPGEGWKLVNLTFCNMLGYSRQELNKLKFSDITHPDDLKTDRYYHNRIIRGKTDSYVADKRYISKQGELVYATLYVKAIRNDNNEVDLLVAFVRDNTEENSTSEMLQLYKHIVSSSRDLLAYIDGDHRYLAVNESFQEFLDKKRDEIIGKTLLELFGQELEQSTRPYLDRCLAGQRVQFDQKVDPPGKESRYVHITYDPHFESDGSIKGVVASGHDITELKVAEDRLKTSERSYRMLFTESPVPLWETDFSDLKSYIEGFRAGSITDLGVYLDKHPEKILEAMSRVKVLSVNRAVREVYGIDNNTDLSVSLQRTITEDSLPVFRDIIMSIDKASTRYKSDTILQDCQQNSLDIDLEWLVMPECEESLSRVLISTLDITDRKNIENRLNEEKANLKKILDSMFVFVGLFTTDGLLIEVNRAPLERASLERGDVLGKPFHETYWWAYSSDVQERLRVALKKAVAGEFVRYDELVRMGENDFVSIDIMFGPIYNKTGEVTQIVGSAVDITDRIEKGKKLEESEERLRLAEEAAGIDTWEWDIATGTVIRGGTIGNSPQRMQLAFDDWLRSIYPDDRDSVRATLLATVEIPEYTYQHEYRVLNHTGTVRYISSRGRVVIDDIGNAVKVLGANIDITDRKQIELDIRIFRNIVEASDDAMAFLDSEYKFRAVNRQFCLDIGRIEDDIVGRSYAEIFGEEYFHHKRKSALDRCLHGEKVYFQDWVHFPGCQPVFRDIHYNPYRNKADCVSGIVINVRDITRQKQAEDELLYREKQLTEAQDIANLGFWEINLSDAHNTVFLSEQMHRLCGIPPDGFDCTYAGFLELIHPDDRNAIDGSIWSAEDGEHFKPRDFRIVRRDGKVINLYTRGKFIMDNTGGVNRLFGIAIDKTSLLIAGEQLMESREQLRNLAAKLHTIREEERSTVARDIHDELGQALTALKIDVSMILSHMPMPDNELKKLLGNFKSNIDNNIDFVRKLSSSLRPAMLDDLGLEAAIEWQIADFTERMDCKCNLGINIEGCTLAEVQRTAVFRIFQEALNNIARHAYASHVDIKLDADNERLTMQIRDDGRGINDAAINSPSSIGITGMKERALMFGGEVIVSGNNKRGTQVILTMPIKRNNNDTTDNC